MAGYFEYSKISMSAVIYYLHREHVDKPEIGL